MNDIVYRLQRKGAYNLRGEWQQDPLTKEAADEIERLRGLLREARGIVGIGAPYQRDLNARIDAALAGSTENKPNVFMANISPHSNLVTDHPAEGDA